MFVEVRIARKGFATGAGPAARNERIETREADEQLPEKNGEFEEQTRKEKIA